MSAPALTPHHLVGTWLLLSCQGHSSGGDVLDIYGGQPQGQLMYDPNGYMAVVLMRLGRPAFASADPSAATDDELRAAFQGFDAYCGTYTVDPDRGAVVHHLKVARFPNWVGSDQTRFVAIDGDRLTLKAPPILLQGVEWTIFVEWQRAP